MSTIASAAAASSNGKNLDVFVHRVRHVNYIPKGVLCLRAAPPQAQHPQLLASSEDGGNTVMTKSNAKQTQTRQGLLAIAREGGLVELVDAHHKFISVATVPGMPSREIGDLAWLQQSQSSSTKDASTSTATLVGASSTDGTLFAVDFAHQRHSSVLALGGGAIFCLQPLVMGGASGASSFLAAGCEDGSVRIVSYQGNRQENYFSGGRQDSDEQLFVVESIMPTTSTVLSLAWWHNPQSSKKSNQSSLVGYLYAGCADGTIRRFECTRKGASQSSSSQTPRFSWKTSSDRITVDHLMGSPTPTKVWSLICVDHSHSQRAADSNDDNEDDEDADSSSDPLSQHTLVSGNSVGMMHFWEPRTMTLLNSMRQTTSASYEAEGSAVLCLALNSRQDRLYASGEDNRIVCFARTSAATSSWVVTEAFRPHTHVVQSLAIIVPSASSSSQGSRSLGVGAETLVSGGMDTKLCTIPVTSTGSSLHHKMDVTVPRRIRDSARPKHLYLWPGSDGAHPIQISGEMGIMTVMRLGQRRIDFYRLAASSSHPAAFRSNRANNGHGTGSASTGIPPIKLFGIELESPFNLNCFAYSQDGSLLAVSDGSGTTLLQITYDFDHDGMVVGGSSSPVMSLLEDDDDANSDAMSSSSTSDNSNNNCNAEEELKTLTCCSMTFSNNGLDLIAASSLGPVTVFRLDPETHRVQESKTCTEHMDDDSVGHDDTDGYEDHDQSPPALLPMTRLTLSSDGRWLVAGRNGIGENAIHVFRLPSSADTDADAEDVNGGIIDGIGSGDTTSCSTFQHWWRVPVLHQTANTSGPVSVPHTCVRFAGDSSLVVAHADNTFFILDVETKSLSDWSQEMMIDSHPCKTLPAELIQRKDYPTGCAMNPSTPNKFLLVSDRRDCR
jgi:hypothetical protein